MSVRLTWDPLRLGGDLDLYRRVELYSSLLEQMLRALRGDLDLARLVLL